MQQLDTLAPEYRLIVLHPNYIQQNLLLTRLVQQQNTAYVQFEGRALSADQINDQLNAAFDGQGVALDALSALVLAECDRASADALDDFLPELCARMPDTGRIYLLTRAAPRCVRTVDSLRQQTCFLPQDDNLMLWDYARRADQTAALLEVRALGGGRVHLNGQPIDAWDGMLPRALFFYSIDRGMTTRNDIFETFWPSLSVREATNVFHVTKRKISEVLGIDLTSYWSGFYHISPEIELSYDVVQFSELVQASAIETPEHSEALLRRAVSLYRSPFLSALEMGWVHRRRSELHHIYGDALINLGKLLERAGQKREALGLFTRAATTNPQREDVAHSCMILYRDLGYPDDALRVYERLESVVHNNLGVAPAPRLQELAAALRQAGG